MTTQQANRPLAVNFPRLEARLKQINAINRQDDGSCCRLALTDADREARDLVVSWMHDAGMVVKIDQIGNIIGISGNPDDGAPVMTGSHLDTVATGGRYDGTYGVLAGIEAIQRLAERNVTTRRPLAVAVFTNEEGVRFAPDMMGSLVYAGGLPLADALATRAEDGTKLGDELCRIGYAGTTQCGEIRPHAFVEVHVEQGPVLHTEGRNLAAVARLQGILWQEILIRGTANHAGTTPMHMRSDAAFCAGRIAVFARSLAERIGGDQVATVGYIKVVPNLVNVIAREARVLVDLRNPDDAVLAQADQQLIEFIADLERAEGVTIERRVLVRTPPVGFDQRVVAAIESAAVDVGQGPIGRMTSGAGHDAQMMARICPAAMIFVPSTGGISHSPEEHTEPHQLEAGANVLMHAMERLANERIQDRDCSPDCPAQ